MFSQTIFAIHENCSDIISIHKNKKTKPKQKKNILKDVKWMIVHGPLSLYSMYNV